jgi:hypothetical protein
MAAPLAGEHVAAGPQVPHGMRKNSTATYASSVSTDVAAYEDLPGYHLLSIRNLMATTNDESYHGLANKLPLATSHGYAECDFSGVPDPVMCWQFLDVVDYWFGCSDNSSEGSYDPARECFVVTINEHVDGADRAGRQTRTPRPRAKPATSSTSGQCRHRCAAGSGARARG